MLPVISRRVTSVETPENRILGRVRNTGTIISDRNKKISAVLRKRKCDFSIFRYLTDRIVKKDSQYLADSFRVTGACRKLILRKFDKEIHMVLLH